jgi:hypothetical protein
VWYLEKHFHTDSKNCINWIPVVTQARSEKEAWSKLYEYDSTIWWVLQGEPTYKKCSNMALQLHNDLTQQGAYKTDSATKPITLKQGSVITPKTISGDLKNIKPGVEKRIVWDILSDGINLSGKYHVIVSIKKHMLDVLIVEFIMEIPNFVMPFFSTLIPINVCYKLFVTLLHGFRNMINPTSIDLIVRAISVLPLFSFPS